MKAEFILLLCFTCSLIAMEQATKRDAIKSISYLRENDQLPHVDNDGLLDLCNLQIESLDGLEEVSQQQDILMLYLAHNRITVIPPSLFPNIVILDLSNNPIKKLDTTAFQHLELLNKFFCSSAQLEEISPTVFQHIPRLTLIDLSYNNLTILPHNLFHSVTSLSTLNLCYNQLQELHPDALQDQIKLKKLNLSHNQLRTIPQGFLCHQNKLWTLDISANQLHSLNDAIFDEQNALAHLHANNNLLIEFPKAILKHCKKLRVINLKYNRIAEISPSIIDELPALQALPLEGNPGFDDLCQVTIDRLKERKIFTGNNFHANDAAPKTAPELVKQLLCQEKFFEFFYPYALDKNLFIVDLANRGLHSLEGLEKIVPYPERVAVLYAPNNFLETIPIETLRHFPHLELLDLANNKITSWGNEPLPLPKLERLRLTGNALRTINRTIFIHLSSLRSLRLNQNEISSIEDGAFDGLSALRSCSLDQNQLSGFPANLFNPTSKTMGLEAIDLSHNELGAIDLRTFAPNVVVRIYPQNPQKLSMVAAQCIMKQLTIKTPKEIIAHLRRIPKTTRHLLRIIASKEMDLYIDLCDKIESCITAFENPSEDFECMMWQEIFEELVHMKWDDGIKLFLHAMDPEPLHKKLLAKWLSQRFIACENMKLAKLAHEINTLPEPLLKLYRIHGSIRLLTRLHNAQRVFSTKQTIVELWHHYASSKLQACAKKDPNEESPQQRLVQITNEWHEALAIFREQFNNWGLDLKDAFLSMCPGKLRDELKTQGFRLN